MIKRIEIERYEALKETTIIIDCGLLYNDNYIINELAELINKYERDENENNSNND